MPLPRNKSNKVEDFSDNNNKGQPRQEDASPPLLHVVIKDHLITMNNNCSIERENSSSFIEMPENYSLLEQECTTVNKNNNNNNENQIISNNNVSELCEQLHAAKLLGTDPCKSFAEASENILGITDLSGSMVARSLPELSTEEYMDLTETIYAMIELWQRQREKLDKFNELLESALAAEQLCSSFVVDTKTTLQREHDDDADNFLASKGAQQRVKEIHESVKRKTMEDEELQRKLEEAFKKRRKNIQQPSLVVLQAWFEEHMDQPYPSNRDKDELAKKANISPSQVSNWFINMRKRHWKHGDTLPWQKA